MNAWAWIGIIVLFILWSGMCFLTGAFIASAGAAGARHDEMAAREARARTAHLN